MYIIYILSFIFWPLFVEVFRNSPFDPAIFFEIRSDARDFFSNQDDQEDDFDPEDEFNPEKDTSTGWGLS